MHTGAAHRQDMVNLPDACICCNETCHAKPSSLQLRRLHGFLQRPFCDLKKKRFSKNKRFSLKIVWFLIKSTSAFKS